MTPLAEVAAELETIAEGLRGVGQRIAARDDLERYYLEREDIRGQIDRIAAKLDEEASLSRRVAAQLGDREERL